MKHEAKKLKWIESGATNCVEAVGVPGSKKKIVLGSKSTDAVETTSCYAPSRVRVRCI